VRTASGNAESEGHGMDAPGWHGHCNSAWRRLLTLEKGRRHERMRMQSSFYRGFSVMEVVMEEYRPLKRFGGTSKDHDRTVDTVCRECTVACGLTAHVDAGTIVDVQGREDHPISRGRLCAKGMAFVQGIGDSRRIVQPALRPSRNEPFKDLDNWDAALDLLAERLRKVRDQSGPESLVIGCDPEAGPDFAYPAKRFARLWGTSFVFHPWDEPEGMLRAAGAGSPDLPCTSWPESRTLLLVDADLASSHPVTFGRALDARFRGSHLVVADSRFTRTMSKADLPVNIKPRTGNVLGLALMKLLLESDLLPETARERARAESLPQRESLEEMTVEAASAATGMSPEKLMEVARMIASGSPVTIVTGKRLAYLPNYGVWPAMTAALGKPEDEAGGWYPLDSGRPQFDVMGDIEEAEEAVLSWIYGDHRALAMKIMQAHREAPRPPIKALIASGNCLIDFMSPFRETAADMDLAVSFAAFPNETVQLSNMLFPATFWAERDEVVFTNDRGMEWGSRIVEPTPDCRTGLDFWMGLAERFGWESYFPWKREDGRADLRSFADWLLKRSPQTAACSVDLLEESSREGTFIAWPYPEGRLVRGTGRRPASGSARTEAGAGPLQVPDAEENGDGFPLAFQAGHVVSRSRDASNWWPWTAELEDDATVQINPLTAKALGIENGEEIIVEGPRHMLEGRAKLSRAVPEWMIWARRRRSQRRALVRKKDQTRGEALDLLRELLQ
jgi:anaerobic selenocysteine-containing dehydrogenase